MEIARVSFRVIAICMIITNHQNCENGLILISAYAPIGADSDETWTSFFEDYDAALKMCKINDKILAGMDGKLSMGTNDGNVYGTFGIPHTNDAGRRMHPSCQSGISPQPPPFSRKIPRNMDSSTLKPPPTNYTTSSKTRANSSTSQMQELKRA